MSRFLALVVVLFFALSSLHLEAASNTPPTPNLFLSIVPLGPVHPGQEFTAIYRFGNLGETNGGLALLTFYTPIGLELAGQPQGANAVCSILRAHYQPVVACTVDSIPTGWQHYIMLRYRVRARIPTTLLLRGDVNSPYDDPDMGNNHLSYALEVAE